MGTHLRANDKGHQRNGNHNVDPHEPAQECKVGSDAGAKVRFDFLDAQLPWYEHGEETDCFAFPVPPALQKEQKERGKRDMSYAQAGVHILIAFLASLSSSC